MPKEKQPTVDPEAVASDGLYSAAESDDNSVFVSDTAYVGVSPEYANHANDTDAPMRSENEDVAKLEERAREEEEAKAAAATKVGFRGYESDTPHPTEATRPGDAYIEGNRALLSSAVNQSKESNSGSEGDEEETPSSPLGQ